VLHWGYFNHFSKKNTTIINSKFLINQLLDKSEFEKEKEF